MQTYPVLAGEMSSLLDTRKEYELVAEPYRLQGDVILSVTYSEYKKYLANPSVSRVMLASGTEKTIALHAAKSDTLYNQFLIDVAFAIGKEVYFSELENQDATVILPQSTTGLPIPIDKFRGRDAECIAYQRLIERWIGFRVIRSERNRRLTLLAGALLDFAHLPRIQGELNIVVTQGL